MDKEIIIDRERVELIVNDLLEMLKNPNYYQFKIRLGDKKIEITPHSKPVEIVLSRD